jgi:hypothetical protein
MFAEIYVKASGLPGERNGTHLFRAVRRKNHWIFLFLGALFLEASEKDQRQSHKHKGDTQRSNTAMTTKMGQND